MSFCQSNNSPLVQFYWSSGNRGGFPLSQQLTMSHKSIAGHRGKPSHGRHGRKNPNFKARNSKQILNSNSPMFKTSNCSSLTAFVKDCFGHLNLRFWLLFRISDLEFRIYPLLSQKNPVSHPLCPAVRCMGEDQF